VIAETSTADAPLWTKGNLVFARAVVDAVSADAVARYATDEEACGYLRGPASEPLLCDDHTALVNNANKLHALDPETYFRTARLFFSFNEKTFDDAVRASAAEGRPVKVLYHSHLDADAYFSATDAAVLSFGEPPAFEGAPSKVGPGPAWPLAFLVTSVFAGAVREHRLFVWDGPSSSFVPSSFTVV